MILYTSGPIACLSMMSKILMISPSKDSISSSQRDQLVSGSSNDTKDACADKLSRLDAILYGFPGGIVLAIMLLMCFVLFGHAITGQRARAADASASSNTRVNKRDALGRKKNRGPPPSAEMRPIDMRQMALREDAPDDIKAMAMAGKISGFKNQKVLIRKF